MGCTMDEATLRRFWDAHIEGRIKRLTDDLNRTLDEYERERDRLQRAVRMSVNGHAMGKDVPGASSLVRFGLKEVGGGARANPR